MRTITVGDQRFQYEFLGEGPLVVLVNNPTVVDAVQRTMAAPLVKAGRQVLIFENRGPDSASVSEWVEGLAGLLDALEVKSACLWGWSLGAAMIQDLARSRPDLTERLVLLGAIGRVPAFLRMFFQAWNDALTAGPPASTNLVNVIFGLGLWNASLLGSDDAVAALTGSPASPEVGRRAARASLAHEPRPETLAAITAPTLVVGFELDLLTPPALGREVADSIKSARYVEIAGATHGGPLTHAQQVLDVALPFLAEGRSR